jgi:hypothetical protein
MKGLGSQERFNEDAEGWTFTRERVQAARLAEWIAPIVKHAENELWIVDGGDLKALSLKRALRAAVTVTGDLYFLALPSSFFSRGFFSLIWQIASSLPKRFFVSKVTVAANVSSSPESFRSLGTRHEYPQVPPQPKGIVPSATFFPEESVMTTVGSNAA